MQSQNASSSSAPSASSATTGTALPDLSRLSRAYLEPLLAGDRNRCRQIVADAFAAGCSARDLLTGLVWPAMDLMRELYREDRISTAMLNLATRLNRSLSDQITGQLTRKATNGRSVLIVCGDAEPEELGGQICSDLFEAEGYAVRFAGGGVPADEVLKLVGDLRPDLLVLYATLPAAVPQARKLIDYLRQVNSCPDMQVMCCGGIYRRAEGLAEEIGADLYAPDAADAVAVAEAHPSQRATPDQQTVGRTRRIKKAAARKTARAARSPRMAPKPVGLEDGLEGEASAAGCEASAEGGRSAESCDEEQGECEGCEGADRADDGHGLNAA